MVLAKDRKHRIVNITRREYVDPERIRSDGVMLVHDGAARILMFLLIRDWKGHIVVVVDDHDDGLWRWMYYFRDVTYDAILKFNQDAVPNDRPDLYINPEGEHHD